MARAIINEAKLNRIVSQCVYEYIDPRSRRVNRLTEKRLDQIVNESMQSVLTESFTNALWRRIPFTNANKYIRKIMLAIDRYEKAWKEMELDITSQQNAERVGTVSIRAAWNSFVNTVIETKTKEVATDTPFDPSNNSMSSISPHWDSIYKEWKTYTTEIAQKEFEKFVVDYKRRAANGQLGNSEPNLYDSLWNHNIGVSTNSNNNYLVRGKMSNATSSESDPCRDILNNLSSEDILEMFYRGVEEQQKNKCHNGNDMRSDFTSQDKKFNPNKSSLYVWYCGSFSVQPSDSAFQKVDKDNKLSWENLLKGGFLLNIFSNIGPKAMVLIGVLCVLKNGCTGCIRNGENTEFDNENDTTIVVPPTNYGLHVSPNSTNEPVVRKKEFMKGNPFNPEAESNHNDPELQRMFNQP